MRQYTDTVIDKRTGRPKKIPKKGVKLIHLFNKVWRIGRSKMVDGKLHCVIYSPEDKEYHVWGNDVKYFYFAYDPISNTYYETGRSTPEPARVKIYILTSILDNRDNWCFDLRSKPEVGKTVKVIYNNGTIKDIIFSGEWESINIPHNFYMDDGSKRPLNEKRIKPVCFRTK